MHNLEISRALNRLNREIDFELVEFFDRRLTDFRLNRLFYLINSSYKPFKNLNLRTFENKTFLSKYA